MEPLAAGCVQPTRSNAKRWARWSGRRLWGSFLKWSHWASCVPRPKGSSPAPTTLLGDLRGVGMAPQCCDATLSSVHNFIKSTFNYQFEWVIICLLETTNKVSDIIFLFFLKNWYKSVSFMILLNLFFTTEQIFSDTSVLISAPFINPCNNFLLKSKAQHQCSLSYYENYITHSVSLFILLSRKLSAELCG
jgi:hypothetical protein